jgi:hypothetical protein
MAANYLFANQDSPKTNLATVTFNQPLGSETGQYSPTEVILLRKYRPKIRFAKWDPQTAVENLAPCKNTPGLCPGDRFKGC